MASRDRKEVTSKQLAELATKVEEAKDAFVSASRREDVARNEATTAMNNLNEKQRALSAAMDTFKSYSPRDTNWWNEKHSSRMRSADLNMSKSRKDT